MVSKAGTRRRAVRRPPHWKRPQNGARAGSARPWCCPPPPSGLVARLGSLRSAFMADAIDHAVGVLAQKQRAVVVHGQARDAPELALPVLAQEVGEKVLDLARLSVLEPTRTTL